MHINKKNKQSGFTLIELLIVIIIIGILAAIAFVAYTGSQQKAHKASAQSELSEAQNKLAEYNADQGSYPASMSAFTTWLGTGAGGNSTSLASILNGTGYTYTATADGGATCDGSATPCTNYTIVASHTALNFTGDDITVQN